MRNHSRYCRGHRQDRACSSIQPESSRHFESSERQNSVSFESISMRRPQSDQSTHHQYRPPDVGIADPRSAMATPTTKIHPEARNQPQTIPTGPAGIEKDRVDAIEGRSPMILNAIPKTSIIVKLRRSSCLYPSLAGGQD